MAVTITPQQLAYALRLVADGNAVLVEPQLTVLNQALGAGTALVVHYVAAAPDAIHNEAVTRVAGYLYDVPPGSDRRAQNALRDSGAMALLSGYRVQRAVAVQDGETTARATAGPSVSRYVVLVKNTWADTGITPPAGVFLVWEIEQADGLKFFGLLPVSALAGPNRVDLADPADTNHGYELGALASGQLALAGPAGTVTVSIWRLS